MLRTTGEGAFELIKKRYNVAASRARDQLWVVHSFDPDHHLKPERHPAAAVATRPGPAGLPAGQRAGSRQCRVAVREGCAEAPDERGFSGQVAVAVGYYRIDLVVEGAGQRLAIECDGDRYHPMEKLAEDMARQAVLERLGWQFVRIRGSAFYRDGDAAMRPVFDRLVELEIPPEVDADVQALQACQRRHPGLGRRPQ
jgi:hypothetical protein